MRSSIPASTDRGFDAGDPSPTVASNFSFGPELFFETSDRSDVAIADFNADGDLDLAFAASQPNTVWLNNGSGVFIDSGERLGSLSSKGINAADLDGNGDLDIIFAEGAGVLNVVDLIHDVNKIGDDYAIPLIQTRTHPSSSE